MRGLGADNSITGYLFSVLVSTPRNNRDLVLGTKRQLARQ